MKKTLATLLAAVMLLTCSVTGAFAAENAPAPDKAVSQTAPFSRGINVNLNGTYLTFDGVAPITADGMTMVPMRAFLESFGAEVGYEDGKITATLKNGDQIALALESTQMTLTQNGKTQTADLGTAPFVMNRTTYLPARAVGEALGLTVTYDSDSKVVYLTDWDALAAEIDTNFTLYNEILTASQAASTGTYDLSKPLQGKINFSANADVNMDGVVAKGDLSLAMNLLMDKLGMSMDMAPKLNLKVTSPTDETPDASLTALMDAISGSNIQLIMDQTTGDMYMKTDLGERMGSAEPDKDAWYHIPSAGVMDMTDLYTELMGQQPLTVGTLLTWYWRTMGETMGTVAGTATLFGADPCTQVRTLADIMSVFYGDSVITKKTVGETTTYSVNQGTLVLGAELVKLGLVDASTIKEMAAAGSIPTVSFQLTATVKEKKLSNMDMKMSMKMTQDDMTMDMNVTCTGTSAKSDVKMDLKLQAGEEHINLSFQANALMAVSTKAAPIAPPTDAKVLELK